MRLPSILIAAMLLVVAACGGDDTTATTAVPETTTSSTAAAVITSAPAFPVTVEADNGPVVVEAMPERIAALSATHVEMLYAIGAGEQLVAGDLFSNHPEEATELTQVDSFNLSVEAVIALDPDLVILTFDPVEAVPALDAVGIPTLLLGTATSLEAAYAQMETLGTATGHAAEAAALVADIDAEIAAIVEETGEQAAGVGYYHETDPFSFYTPNSSSFIGQLYALLGMVNIADEAPDEFGSGFPQLSPEYIIESDPEMIFLAAAGETPETVAARDGWDTMTAVQTGRIVVLDPDVSSRWGPRVVDLMAEIAAGVTTP